MKRLGCARVYLEPEFSLESNGSEHSHRVFSIAAIRLTDQANLAIAKIFKTVDLVEDGVLLRVVIERINGEIAALSILMEAAIDIVR